MSQFLQGFFIALPVGLFCGWLLGWTFRGRKAEKDALEASAFDRAIDRSQNYRPKNLY